MDKIIYAYALIKSVADYGKGKDYLDIFWPFVIQVVPPDSTINSINIKSELKKKFDVDVPLHVLELILIKAKDGEYITQSIKKNYLLTQQGIEYLDKLEPIDDVERRINSLVEDIQKFFKKNGQTITLPKTKELLISFIKKHTTPLVRLINPTAVKTKNIFEKLTTEEAFLIQYVEKTEKNKPEKYQTLQDMILGSIISEVLYVEEKDEILEIRQLKFGPTQIFLDTNFIFSLLSLHSRIENEAAAELFEILNNYGFRLKVFDFTVEELVGVINGYTENFSKYPISVKVDSIYSSLKQRGWKSTDAKEFIIKIEDNLKKLGLKIETTGIKLSSYKPNDEDLRDKMTTYKPFQYISNQNHDIAAIEKIIEYRGKTVRRIEKAEAIFLTSDIRLSKFNLYKMGHKDSFTICEAIPDRLLSCILWLKNPNIKLSLKSIIATHSRDLFVKRRIWKRFYEILRESKKEEKIADETIAMLFYHNYIEDVLRRLDETDIDKIDEDFVIETAETAAKQFEEKTEEKFKKLEEDFIKRLKEETSEVEGKKNKEWLDKIQEEKKKIQGESKSSAKLRILIVKAVIALILAIAVIALFFTTMDLGVLIYAAAGFAILGLFIDILGPIGKIWEKLENDWAEDIYSKKIQDLDKLISE